MSVKHVVSSRDHMLQLQCHSLRRVGTVTKEAVVSLPSCAYLWPWLQPEWWGIAAVMCRAYCLCGAWIPMLQMLVMPEVR